MIHLHAILCFSYPLHIRDLTLECDVIIKCPLVKITSYILFICTYLALIKSDTPPRKITSHATGNGYNGVTHVNNSSSVSQNQCTVTNQTLTSTKLVMAQEMKMENMKIEKLEQTERLYRQEQLKIETEKKEAELKLKQQQIERQREEERKQKEEQKRQEEQRRIEKQREEQRIKEQQRIEKQKEEQRILELQKLEKQKEEDRKKVLAQQREEQRKLEQQQDIRETVVSGNKFNISTSLKKTSKMSSREDLSSIATTTTTAVKQESRSNEIGGHLKGLNFALEALASKQQQEKRSQLITSASKQVQIKMCRNSHRSFLII